MLLLKKKKIRKRIAITFHSLRTPHFIRKPFFLCQTNSFLFRNSHRCVHIWFSFSADGSSHMNGCLKSFPFIKVSAAIALCTVVCMYAVKKLFIYMWTSVWCKCWKQVAHTSWRTRWALNAHTWVIDGGKLN